MFERTVRKWVIKMGERGESDEKKGEEERVIKMVKKERMI